MGLVGCYSMDMYCDIPRCDENCYLSGTHPTFTGRTESSCIRQARREGWLINLKREGDEGLGYVLCPNHSGKKPSRHAQKTQLFVVPLKE